jgi:hypothetical protein
MRRLRVVSVTLRRMTRFSFVRTTRAAPSPAGDRHRSTIPALLGLALPLLALLPGSALAWGAKAHRLIAHLATTELQPQARAEIARLLRGEPDPTLAGVANWADDLRDRPAPADKELGRRTTRWHFVNLPEDDCGYRTPADCPNGDCVIEAIRRQRNLLADRRQPDAVRAQALKFLVHFVGDAHQPLHAGFERDRGGNDVQLRIDGKGSNLHQLWDSRLLASTGENERTLLQRLQRMPLPNEARTAANDPAAWARASCRIVQREGFYPPKRTLTPDYFARWRPTAERQLRIAGHRLAVLLNATLVPRETRR